MKQQLLLLDTLTPKQITLGIIRKGRAASFVTNDLSRGASEDVLGRIKKFFDTQSLTLSALGGVVVTLGPGHFTALRIGVIIANTFAWALHIPVFGYKTYEFKNTRDLATKSWDNFLQFSQSDSQKPRKFRPLVPWYGKEPNITKPRE